MKAHSLFTKYSLLVLFVFISTAFIVPYPTKTELNALSDNINNHSLFDTHLRKIFNSCGLETKGLSYKVFEKGMTGYFNLRNSKKGIISKSILTIVDFEKRSKEKRLWVIDLNKTKVLFNTLVAHGKNTGEDKAINFSNTPQSNMSSLGFYLTEETYCGKHGLSLRLNGLDEGFNSNARDRAIVMHGADYVCEEFISANGRLGRSQGCPALPVKEHRPIIQTIAGGSVLFIHHPTPGYESIYLNKEKAVQQFIKQRKS